MKTWIAVLQAPDGEEMFCEVTDETYANQVFDDASRNTAGNLRLLECSEVRRFIGMNQPAMQEGEIVPDDIEMPSITLVEVNELERMLKQAYYEGREHGKNDSFRMFDDTTTAAQLTAIKFRAGDM